MWNGLTVRDSKQRAAAQFCVARISRRAFAFLLLDVAMAANASPEAPSSTSSKLVAAITMTSTVKAYASYKKPRLYIASATHIASIAASTHFDAVALALGLRCSHGFRM